MIRAPSFFRAGAIHLLMLAPLLLTAGCRGDHRGNSQEGDGSLVLEVGVSPTPPTVGPARLIISLKDTAGTAISGAEVSAEGNMTHAGMVPVLDTARMVSPGHYSVPSFGFTMAGSWILTIEARLLDGRTAQIQKTIHVVGGVSSPDHSDPQGEAEAPN